MSFWPSDLAGQVTDVISVVAFASSVATAFYARIRGNATDRAVQGFQRRLERRERFPVVANDYQNLCLQLAPLCFKCDDPALLSRTLAELRSTVDMLDEYMQDDRKEGLKAVKERLRSLQNQPLSEEHLLLLHGEIWGLSKDVDYAVGSFRWSN